MREKSPHDKKLMGRLARTNSPITPNPMLANHILSAWVVCTAKNRTQYPWIGGPNLYSPVHLFLVSCPGRNLKKKEKEIHNIKRKPSFDLMRGTLWEKSNLKKKRLGKKLGKQV